MGRPGTTRTKRRSCPLCPKHGATPIEADRLTWITHCKRHNAPIVALKRHFGRPSAGELRHLETRAKRMFPLLRWQRPHTFNQHFYLHAVSRTVQCNFDHALAA